MLCYVMLIVCSSKSQFDLLPVSLSMYVSKSYSVL